MSDLLKFFCKHPELSTFFGDSVVQILEAFGMRSNQLMWSLEVIAEVFICALWRSQYLDFIPQVRGGIMLHLGLGIAFIPSIYLARLVCSFRSLTLTHA